MKTKLYQLYFIGTLLCAGTVITSCTDDDLQAESTDPMRMFTPFSLTAVNGETESKVTWKASLHSNADEVKYTTEVSTDSLFTNVNEILISKVTDSAGVVITDQEIPVRKDLFIRVKANALPDRPESYWSKSARFKIIGVQILHPIYDPNVLESQITLSWDKTDGVTKLTFTPFTQASGQEPVYGTPITSEISPAEAASASKTVKGLNPNTRYSVEIYKGNTSVGIQTFTTKTSTNYTIVANPGDDIVALVNNAKNGDVIGLNPGTYNTGDNVITINAKKVSLIGISGNAEDTKVLFKEFTLNDTGAGLHLKNIDLDGTTNKAAYLINLTSSNNNAARANFENILIENCLVHDVSTAAFRANRGPNSGYIMDKFEIKHSFFRNFPASTYGFLHLDKLVFNQVNLENSTFTEVGDLFIRYRESITTPSANATININNCTINSFGQTSIYPLLDNNNVPIKLNFTNNILANSPRLGGSFANNNLIRLATNSSAVFSFNNFYNLTNGKTADLQKLVLPNSATSANNQEQDLSWTNTTLNFQLPTNSPLRTASSSGSAIGDPRWWN